MLVSLALSHLNAARRELETSRRRQADEEKKAAGHDKDAAAKDCSGRSTRSERSKIQYEKDAARNRDDAAAARARAAHHADAAAKATKKVHDAESELRSEENKELKRQSDKRAAEDRHAVTERSRNERARETAHRREVDALQSRVDQQERLLSSAPWRDTPTQIVVLFIASSPEDQVHLRIDREVREIQEKVRSSDHRDAIRFEYAVAAQTGDLIQRLNEVKPDVVHFSGHSDSSGLALEDSDGQTRILNTGELATLLSVSSRRIRLAVFNSCESADHAVTATNHLDAAIGMDESIDDGAARVFASQFYSSVAFGLDLQKAFDQALLQVRLMLGFDSGEPRLYTSDSVSADQIVLVRMPAGDEDSAASPRPSLIVDAAGGAARIERERELRQTVATAVNASRRWAETMQILVIATASARWRDTDWAAWVDTDSGRQMRVDAQTMRDAGPRLRLAVADGELLDALAGAMAALDDSAAFDGVHKGSSTAEARSTAYRHIAHVTRAWATVEAAAAAMLLK